MWALYQATDRSLHGFSKEACRLVLEYTVTLGCVCKIEAGTSGFTGPSSASATARAFLSSGTTHRIRRAFRNLLNLFIEIARRSLLRQLGEPSFAHLLAPPALHPDRRIRLGGGFPKSRWWSRYRLRWPILANSDERDVDRLKPSPARRTRRKLHRPPGARHSADSND